MNLSNLTPAPGSTKDPIRIGRGAGSGKGGTSTKGHKGQQARTGYQAKVGFEGGQMPLQRRIPKFGFKNPFRIEYNVINLDRLQEFVENFPEAATGILDMGTMHEYGLIGTLRKPVKILGRGELTAKLVIHAHKVSDTAKAAIEKAGGSVSIIGHPAATTFTESASN